MELFIILILILLNGIFAMSEIALVSARKTRLENLAGKGDQTAKAALKLANNPDRFFSTVQIGITLIGILMGLYSGEKLKGPLIGLLNRWPLLQPFSHTLAVILVVLVITYFSLVLGELVPKRIGLARPEYVSMMMAPLMNFLSKITFPFIWLLTVSSNLIVRIFHIRTIAENHVTEEEIKAMIHEGTSSGEIEESEQEIIERVFHLGDRHITSLMTHRSNMVWINAEDSPAQYQAIIHAFPHSVYPVCEGKMDDLLGVIYIRDLYLAGPGVELRQLVKRPVFIPEGNSAYQVMEKFKQTKIHFAFIVDEYGSVQGMITLNDILEAIVGDMPQPDQKEDVITPRADGSFLMDGQIPFYDFLTHVDRTEWLSEETHDFDTLAGFILHHLEHIPKTGERMQWKDFTFEIMDMDGHRIDKILVMVTSPGL
ncbi:MAG: hemolysin family protein [Chitinophagaceae bacterium]